MFAARAMAAIGMLCAAAGAQDPVKYSVMKFATGYRFTEGPAFAPDGSFYFSDIPGNRILRAAPGGKVEVWRENSGGANGNAFDSEGRLYTCEGRARRVTRTDKNGNVQTLADQWEGKRLNAPNDLVVARNGTVYFTDPAFGNQDDQRDLDFYGVYQIAPRGPLKLVAKWKTRPNGITLSHNQRTLYVVDSDQRVVRAFDLDRAGEATNERVVVANIVGVPDGIRCDSKGNLWIAANGIAVYTPAGVLQSTISISEKPSNLAFHEGDPDSLWVTARTTVYHVRLNVEE